tara:strand:- start:114 stop:515 length:402 start_codon:yes stop_codon:yes gene_type:complete
MTAAEILETIASPYGAFGAIVLTYIFNKERERAAEIRREKLEHYKEFVRALGEYVVKDAGQEKRSEFTRACNRMYLVASKDVLEKLEPLLRGLKNEESEEAVQLKLDQLIHHMRKDLGFARWFNSPTRIELSQ